MADIGGPNQGPTQWGQDEGDNTSQPPHGAPEGWLGKQVNDWGREVMASVRRWWQNPQWVYPLHDAAPRGAKNLLWVDPSNIRISNVNLVSLFPIGTIIEIYPSAGNPVIARVENAVFSTHTTITVSGPTLLDAGYQDDGIGIASARDVSSLAWGGYGDAAARTAKWPNPPDGILWHVTGDDDLTLSVSGSWFELAHLSAWSNKGGALTVDDGSSSPTGQALVDLKVLTAAGTQLFAQEATTPGTYLEERIADVYLRAKGVANTALGDFNTQLKIGADLSLTYQAGHAASPQSLRPGPGNGLDADTLDGVELVDIAPRRFIEGNYTTPATTNAELTNFRNDMQEADGLTEWVCESDAFVTTGTIAGQWILWFGPLGAPATTIFSHSPGATSVAIPRLISFTPGIGDVMTVNVGSVGGQTWQFDGIIRLYPQDSARITLV